MPLTRETTQSSALPDADTLLDRRQQFCDGLKAARKRRGIAIADIAATTKVCPTYFVALERNDLSLWPKGLFRRAFFRGYAGELGLPVTETLEEFVRLFPDDDRPVASAATAAPIAPTQEFRLALDESWHGSKAPIGRRLAVAAADTVLVTALAAAISWIASISFATVLAVIAMTYFTVVTAVLAESPAATCLRWSPSIFARLKGAPAAAATDEAQQSDDERRWITDARRVRPRSDPPRLRVRFKLSS